MTTRDKIVALANEIKNNDTFEDRASASILFSLAGSYANPVHLLELSGITATFSIKILNELEEQKRIRDN